MRRRTKFALWVLGLMLLLAGGLSWFTSSGYIDRYVLERAVLEVEKSIGAKLVIGKLKIDVWGGRAVMEDVILRGKEAAGEQPLFSAKQIQIQAGLASLSASRVDLRGLLIKEPVIHLVTYPDGTTNIPGPKTRNSNRGALETLINWRLGKLEVERGEFRWNEIKTPFEVQARDILAKMEYVTASRSYRGKLDAGSARYQMAALPPIQGTATVDFGIEREKVRIDSFRFHTPAGTEVSGRGNLTNVDNREEPIRLDMDIEAAVAVREALPFLKLPVEPVGRMNYKGKLLFESGRGFELHGDARGRDLYYKDATTRLGPVMAKAKLDFLPARLTLSDLRAEGLGGSVDGNFLWDQQEGWSLDGNLSKLNIATILKQLNVKEVPWSGVIHGPIEAKGGKKPLIFSADLEITSTSGPSPLDGLLAMTYEEAGNRLLVRNSFLALPHSRINFAGDLGLGIALELRSTQFRELLPILELAGFKEDQLPLGLQQGSGSVNGQLTGTIKKPHFRGTIAAEQLLVSGRQIDKAKGKVDYGDELLTVDQFDLESMDTTIKGNLRATLESGRLEPESLLSGKLDVQVADLGKLGLAEPITGSVTGTLALRGTWAEPIADGNLRSAEITVRDFQFQQIAAAFTGSRRELKVGEWEARLDRQPIRGVLNLKAGGNDWKIGSGNAALKVEALPLMSIPQYRQQAIAVNAQLTTDSQMDFNWSPQGVSPSKLDGKLSLSNITRFGRPIGQLEFTSRTTGQRASLTALGSIGKLPVKGDATIQFGTRLNTELRLQLPKLDFPTIAQLFSEELLPSPLPYEGGAEASFFFKGPLLDPQGWDGQLTIPQIQLAPNKDYVRETMPSVADVVLRNQNPIVFEFKQGSISTRDVRLVAKDTNLTASLLYRSSTKGLTGQVKGTINLAVLSTLKPDLLTKGAATLDANIQGTTDDPQLNGRLAFQNASFYLRDVITGLDKVNGTVLFDKSRATIEDLKAQTGGGELQLTGFVGFGKNLSYRLQAQATQVRLRYPEGVSTSANGTLALTGTTAQSILTGNISILRSSIGQIDTAQLLSGSGGIGENTTPIQNEFLRNMQFDVRIEAAQNVEFSTAFTKDVKGEIALRLRGTPQRPVLLGRIVATQGEIDFFGSRYQISRAEVTFNNPLRIEPIIGMDLETRVRGVVISMNFSGPASKLNMSYRSDPPLQSGEILALLTVGRNPGASSSIAQTPVGQNQGMFGNDSSVILGAAVTAGINGRLQRFFGISRVRIDPQLTGIDNVPQARLTLEQQVSRDVTLTYITNLNRTQQQIVRIDWDISRAWSVVAVRDENGIFGLDLFFRKRLK